MKVFCLAVLQCYRVLDRLGRYLFERIIGWPCVYANSCLCMCWIFMISSWTIKRWLRQWGMVSRQFFLFCSPLLYILSIERIKMSFNDMVETIVILALIPFSHPLLPVPFFIHYQKPCTDLSKPRQIALPKPSPIKSPSFVQWPRTFLLQTLPLAQPLPPPLIPPLDPRLPLLSSALVFVKSEMLLLVVARPLEGVSVRLRIPLLMTKTAIWEAMKESLRKRVRRLLRYVRPTKSDRSIDLSSRFSFHPSAPLSLPFDSYSCLNFPKIESRNEQIFID